MASEIVGHFSYHPEQSWSLSILFVLTEKSTGLFPSPPGMSSLLPADLADTFITFTANNLIRH